MDPVIFAVLALGHLLLLAYALRDAARGGWATPASLPLLVLVGLVYDNGILALGSFVGEGALLEGLNAARYWIHALVTPGLVLFAWHVAARASRDAGRATWLRGRPAATVAALVVAGLVVLELFTVAGLDLEVRREHGVLAYEDVGSGGPPVMVLVVALALVAAGAVALWLQGWWWLLVGSLVMTAGSAVPAPDWSGAVTNVLELVLLTSVVATRHHQDRRDGDPGDLRPAAAAQ